MSKFSFQQLIRYGLVGIASNIILYFFYLMITFYGFTPKTAMTLCYAVGVAQSFCLNRNWTFGHSGKVSSALVRYVIIYGIGFLFNLAVLVIFVDQLGWVHQWVQGATIPIVAILIFFAQKIWVFSTESRENV